MKRYSSKLEALENREAGKKLFKSKKWIAACDTPVSQAGGYWAINFFWN